jgi:uncharacterized membrane protein
MKSLRDTLLFSATLGFFFIWLGEVFKGYPLKSNYFWLMLALICLMLIQVFRGAEKKEIPTNKSINSSKKKKK